MYRRLDVAVKYFVSGKIIHTWVKKSEFDNQQDIAKYWKNKAQTTTTNRKNLKKLSKQSKRSAQRQFTFFPQLGLVFYWVWSSRVPHNPVLFSTQAALPLDLERVCPSIQTGGNTGMSRLKVSKSQFVFRTSPQASLGTY
jgi:hypothetical protein